MLITVGTLIGISNTLGSLTGFIGPAVVGALTDKNVSKHTVVKTSKKNSIVIQLKGIQRPAI